jgi:hypothetical protein
MSFAALAIVFLIACVALGSRTALGERARLAFALASALVVAQLALLLS